MLLDCRYDDWPVHKGVAMVAGLLAHGDQRIPGDQALSQLMIECWWWGPPSGLTLRGKAGQDGRVERICLAAPPKRFGEVAHLGGISDRHMEASSMQGHGQRDPVGAGRLHHN